MAVEHHRDPAYDEVPDARLFERGKDPREIAARHGRSLPQALGQLAQLRRRDRSEASAFVGADEVAGDESGAVDHGGQLAGRLRTFECERDEARNRLVAVREPEITGAGKGRAFRSRSREARAGLARKRLRARWALAPSLIDRSP